MKKTYILTLILLSFALLGCGSDKHEKIIEDQISLEVELEQNMTNKKPLDIILKLTNLSDKTVYYENLAVPFNKKETTSLNIFKVVEDGVTLAYTGLLVDRYSVRFNSLNPGETFTASVALDKIYKVTKGTHLYQISYMDTISAKTSDGKSELLSDPKNTGVPLQPNELAPKDHTSRYINIKANTLEFEANIKKIREPNYH